MNDEYAIDAKAFTQALLEQRQMRLAGGLYHLNQILLAYNSNRIEGSQLSAEQTRYLYETRTVDGVARVDDIVETINHFRMFDLMLDNVGKPLTVGLIKEYHRILKTGTSHQDRDWFAVGDWKRRPNFVGDTQTSPPGQVGEDIAALIIDYDEKALTFEDICDFHARFETIHPFQDGNGRVGRIIMFGQCLSNDIMPFIVLDDEKFFYYRGLSRYLEQPGFLRDTLRHFQDRYYDAFAKYVTTATDGL